MKIATLTCKTAEGDERTVTLNRRVFRIGRVDDNDLVLENPYISRYHAEIRFDGFTYGLRDLSSTSGTFVNGDRVEEQTLTDGDCIRLGKARGMEFVFRAQESHTLVDAEGYEEERLQTVRVMAPEEARFLNTDRLATTEDLGRKTVERLRALYEFTSDCLSAQSADDLCARLSDFLVRALRAERCAVLLYNRERDSLEVSSSRSADDGCKVFPSRGIASRVFGDNLSILSIDATTDERFSSHKSVQLQAIRSVMGVPIGTKSRVWGVCYVDNLTTAGAFEDEELEFLTAVARQAGLALENLFLLDEQRRSLESFIRTLSASIGARDDSTAGHSARVGSYSSGIAKRMRLHGADCRLVYYAGLLHDYGKIGTRDDVLLKPSELTPEEYEHIKEHPLHTFRILSKIRFPIDLAEIPIVAAAHHERWDGTGYPHGLKAEEIPLGSRIVSVADAYDALVEERPYHEAIEPEVAVLEITKRSGSYFDPTVVQAFLDYYNEEISPRLIRRVQTLKTVD